MGIQAPVEADGLSENDLEQVSNAAGTGARLALISKAERQKAVQIAQNVGYIELATVPNFNRKFAAATFL